MKTKRFNNRRNRKLEELSSEINPGEVNFSEHPLYIVKLNNPPYYETRYFTDLEKAVLVAVTHTLWHSLWTVGPLGPRGPVGPEPLVTEEILERENKLVQKHLDEKGRITQCLYEIQLAEVYIQQGFGKNLYAIKTITTKPHRTEYRVNYTTEKLTAAYIAKQTTTTESLSQIAKSIPRYGRLVRPTFQIEQYKLNDTRKT